MCRSGFCSVAACSVSNLRPTASRVSSISFSPRRPFFPSFSLKHGNSGTVQYKYLAMENLLCPGRGVHSSNIMSQNATGTDRYLLQRGAQESCRLTAQHHLITQRFGGLLHPALANEIKMRKDLAIADAGCGNGIWAIEVAEQYPTAEVAAIDVSNFQFPPQWTIPDNCSFHRLDLMQPIGEEYAHSFDLINVRLLAGPLDATDCSPIVH